MRLVGAAARSSETYGNHAHTGIGRVGANRSCPGSDCVYDPFDLAEQGDVSMNGASEIAVLLIALVP